MKRIILFALLLVFFTGFSGMPALAATTKTGSSSANKYFHKRKLVHKKAPIPKDPKPTKADIKKAKQQAIAGKGYVKVLKGWLRKKKTSRRVSK